MEWPFSRVRKIFFRGRNFQENPWNSTERAIFTEFQAPKFENSEPEKMQFHTPSRFIPPLDSLLICDSDFWCCQVDSGLQRAPNHKMWDLKCNQSGKKKAHKHKLFCPVGPCFSPDLSQGQTQFVPGTNPLKNRETQEFSLFYTVEARFHRVCPWDKPSLSQGQSRGRRAAQKVYVKKVYVPFSLANQDRPTHLIAHHLKSFCGLSLLHQPSNSEWYLHEKGTWQSYFQNKSSTQ